MTLDRCGSIAGRVSLGNLLLPTLLGLAAVLLWMAFDGRDADRSTARLLRAPESEPVAGSGFGRNREESASPVPMAAAADTSPDTAEPETKAGGGSASHAASRVVTVTVVDEAHRPVSEARVDVFRDEPVDVTKLPTYVAHESSDVMADRARLQEIVQETMQAEPAWGVPTVSAVTRADGTVELEVPTTPLLLFASLEGTGNSGIVPLDVTGVDSEPSPHLVLKLAPPVELHGRVDAVSGEPLPGAHVVFTRALRLDDHARRPRLPLPLDTDGDGTFRLLVDADFINEVHAEARSRRTPTQLAQASARLSKEVILRFAGAFAVTGVVLGPGDVPLPRADVRVSGYEVHADAVFTDEQGRFRLELSRPGRVPLFVRATDVLQARPEAAAPTTLAPVVDVTIRMIKPTVIAGRLQWDDGTPIPGQALSANATSTEINLTDMSSVLAHLQRDRQEEDFTREFTEFALTRADGGFRFQQIHPDIPYDIRCHGGDSLPGSVTEKAVAPGTTNLLLTYDRASIGANLLRGRVLDEQTRAPIGDCEIACSDWIAGSPMAFGQERQSVRNAQGSFEFTGLDLNQRYGFVVEAVDYPSKDFGPFTPSADGSIELLLGRPAGLHLVVTDDDGEPQPGARVQLMKDAGRGFGAMFSDMQVRETGLDGLLNWPNIPPGVYSLEAVAGTRRAPRRRVTLGPGEPAIFELVVTAPEHNGQLTVLTRHANGAPWPGAGVKVVQLIDDEEATPGLEAVYQLDSDSQGQVLLQGLDPGEYAVMVSGDGTIIPLKRVDVAEGRPTTLTIDGSS